MLVFETIAVAFAMFSAIPVPQPVWNDRNMRYALCAFPLVGVVLGLLWWCWGALCGVLDLPELLRDKRQRIARAGLRSCAVDVPCDLAAPAGVAYLLAVRE